jgi:hypothetical protein
MEFDASSLVYCWAMVSCGTKKIGTKFPDEKSLAGVAMYPFQNPPE